MTQGIGQLRGLGKRTDEQQIDLVRLDAAQILCAGGADVTDVLPRCCLTPGAHDLRHDAGQVGVHEAGEKGSGRPFRDDVDDADA